MPILFAPSANQISGVTLNSVGYYGSTATLIVSTQGYATGDTIYYTTTGSGQQFTGTAVVNNYLGDIGTANIPFTTNRTTSTTGFTATFYSGTTPVNLTYGINAVSTQPLAIPDPYFTATTLLLTPSGSGTNALTDISGTTSTIQVVGSPNVRSLIPFTTPGVSSSIYLNGTTDYLSTPNNTALDLATGTPNWTIEAWIYPTSTSGNPTIVQKDGISGSRQAQYALSLDGSSKLYITLSTAVNSVGNQNFSSSGAAIQTNTWTHVAVVRSGSSIYVFQNGQIVNGPTTLTTTMGNNTGDLTVGINTGPANYFSGYISNLRIVKGVAVYTGAFTPPTSPLQTTQSAGTNIAAITAGQTSLLLLQSPQSPNNNSFYNSANTGTQVAYVGTVTQGTFSPFSSQYATFFNGSNPNPYLSVLNGPGYGFGTGDFTIEYWIYATSWASGPTVVDLRPVGGTLQFSDNYTTGGAPGIYYAGSQQLTSSITIPVNTWAHVAFTRSGSSITVWVNGAQGATGTSSADLQSSGTPRIGTNNTRVNPLNGYLSNLRIIKGQALYTGTFTPPPLTVRLAATTNTTLLTCQGSLAASTGSDYSTLTNTVTSTGTISAQIISTTTFLTSPYSTSTVGGSIYFNGSSNITISTSTIGYLSLGSGNFSLEAWIYPTSNATEQIIFNKVANGSVVGAFDVRLSTNGTMKYLASKSSGVSWDFILTTTGFVNLNSWNHVAYVRVGDWYRFFINGVAAGTANIYSTPSLTLVDEPTVPINIGANTDGSSRFSGYMTGIRMVKDYSLYTTNTNFSPLLTPPTASLTGTTIVLLNGNNSAVYDATGFNNITSLGATATITSSVVKYGSSSMTFSSGNRLLIVGSTNTNFTVGTGDFTIECWMNFTSNSSAEADIFESATTNFPRILKRSASSGLSFDYFSGALGAQLLIADANIVLGSWFHIAVSRSGGQLRGFVNGALVFGPTAESTSVPVPTAPISIGARYDSSNGFNGYISDFRFTKGVARYTAAFTTATTYLPLI
jgi:Concanavalin A-like lectin/glucanases superfamily